MSSELIIIILVVLLLISLQKNKNTPPQQQPVIILRDSLELEEKTNTHKFTALLLFILATLFFAFFLLNLPKEQKVEPNKFEDKMEQVNHVQS